MSALTRFDRVQQFAWQILKRKRPNSTLSATEDDFSYLMPTAYYFDSACQTLRPQSVIAAMNDYFMNYNACAGRVKYAWGRRLDEIIRATRAHTLRLLGKSERDYLVAFTLNTTYGLNLILQQLKPGAFDKIITSITEHNSLFLPTISAARRLSIERRVLARAPDGSLIYTSDDLKNAVVAVNSMSNVDGRVLMNGRDLIKDVHAAGGLVILDAAQSFGHERARLRSLDYDALCFSAHKTYGPSLGVIVVKKSLLTRFQFDFIGGGMVDDVSSENYELAPQDPSSWFEPGLQNFSGIVGLGAALAWLEHYHPEDREPDVQQSELAEIVFRALRQMPSVRVINQTARPIISFYSEKIDAHRLAIFLSQAGIMVRSGYFCCHAYLKEAMKYPPLVRISLGLNNTRSQVEHLSKTLGTILRNL